jgi:hypothetical protein
MNRKKLVVSTISLLIVIIIFSACGRKGTPFPNVDPFIEITSFAGADSTEAIDETNPDVYQQRIFWNAYDTDGVVRKYAYRVLDINGDPIQTADHEVIDADGWIYHYMDGAVISEDMAPGDNAEIWTNDAYALINFPAADEDGVNEVLTSIFEVKCIDDRGGESIPARKWISSESEVPRVQILSTKGVIDGQIVGTGLTFAFDLAYLSEHDYPVSDYPYYFRFMLKKIGTDDDSTQPDGYGVDPDNPDDEGWQSTKGTDDPKHFTVTNVQTGNFQTFPSIFPNSETLADSTRLYVIGYNLAGVATEIDSVTFQVKEGLNPGSIIYNGYDFINDEMNGAYNTIVAYGDNHFTTLEDDYGTDIPDFNTSEGVKIATPFWVNKDGEFSCLGSNNLRIFMHWGWHGEFGKALQGGNTDINDKPRGESRIGQVVDEDTDTPYFSEVVFFDLRLDGKPYYYAPYPPTPENVVEDTDGTEWLRVPYSHDIAQRTTITRDQILHNNDSFYGLHTFEVRVVDLQMEGDPSPAVMNFRIVERVPRQQKSGILIIDDDVNHPVFAPDDVIDQFYTDVFDGSGEIVDVLDREEVKNSVFIPELHFQRDAFSATDLEPYKFIVYHSDFIGLGVSNIAAEYEVLELYMRGGGNLLVSGGNNLEAVQTTMDSEFLPLFWNYFNIPLEGMIEQIDPDADMFLSLTGNFGTYDFFDKANTYNGFSNDVYLDLPSFNQVVTNNIGLGPVSFLNPNFTLAENVIMTFGCKQPEPFVDSNSDGQWNDGEEYTDMNQNGEFDDWVWDLEDNNDKIPTLDNFNTYNGQVVGIRNLTDNNNCYMFTFPLSYMKTEEVKSMMNTILSELP